MTKENIELAKEHIKIAEQLVNEESGDSKKDPKEPLSYDYIKGYYDTLKSYTYEERILKLDLNLDRADVIIPAMKIFVNIMKWTKSKQIYVPKVGLADGIIKQLAEV